MRRIPTIKTSENRVFKTKINSNVQTFNTSVSKIDNTISTSVVDSSTPLETIVDTSVSQLNIKTDINNQPTDEIYYDEVIIYDGGGVEGYGYKD